MSLVLVIDDEETVLESLRHFFINDGYQVLTAPDGKTGLMLALREFPEVVLLDLKLPDMQGIEVLRTIKAEQAETSVIIMTGYGEVSTAVEAMKAGAEHFFQKPLDLAEISVLVKKCLHVNSLKRQLSLASDSAQPMFGVSRHIQGLIHLVNLLSSNPSITVLITGETGTGKELVARNIHALSPRAGYPFVDINCASIPETILESELFGYEAGAFTDARKTKKGLFEQANGGTIFLDEIGEMPMSAQSKLLRVLETRSLRRLGSVRDIKVDVRVTASTNKDLAAAVKEGKFREDLYYRINVMPVELMPLRERQDDIAPIAEKFLYEACSSMGKTSIKGFSDDALQALLAYPWPGNARELRNVIERAVILSAGNYIKKIDLMLPAGGTAEAASADELTIREMERLHIEKVLSRVKGNRTKAAGLLGISRSTLNQKLKQYASN